MAFSEEIEASFIWPTSEFSEEIEASFDFTPGHAFGEEIEAEFLWQLVIAPASVPSSAAVGAPTIIVWEPRIPLLRVEQMRAPLLGLRRAADLSSTGDQTIRVEATKYVVRRVVVTGATTVAPAAIGGIYTGAGKTGALVVPAGQTYAALGSPSAFMDAALGPGVAAALTAGTLYFSLMAPGAGTVDIYVFGDAIEA